MALFESFDRRIDKINSTLAKYGIKDLEECKKIWEEFFAARPPKPKK